MKKIADGILTIGIFLILAAGAVKTCFLQKNINYYENRYANKLPAFSMHAYLDGTYQKGVDDALMDQVPYAQKLKAKYNYCTRKYVVASLRQIISRNADYIKNHYFNLFGVTLFGGDHLSYWPRDPDAIRNPLAAKAANINKMSAGHPELDFFTYYIEKETDMNFETGKKPGIAENFLKKINLPADRKAIYTVNSFDEFDRWFYKTDAHWNCLGSYRGYAQVAGLLGVKEKLIPPGKRVLVSPSFSGNKATTTGLAGIFRENFYAYRFAYPKMTIRENGQPAKDYGRQDSYFAGDDLDSLNYGNFYGDDGGEIIFDTGNSSRDNLLVIGESYDNAILKLLASHFNRTYSIDLRNYKAQIGHSFHFSQYAAEHHIKKVLLIGNVDFYTLDTFMLED